MSEPELSLSTSSPRKIPLHLISGFLGEGKTTLIRSLLRQLSPRETSAVLVNDFGESGYDQEQLGDQAGLIAIPGGCICCTAPAGMVPALTELIESLSPDRIFIEPTGLARPHDILDTLERSPLRDRLDLAPVLAVVDPRRLLGEPPPLLLEQLDTAGIWVATKSDLWGEEAWQRLQGLASEQHPPLLSLHQCAQGSLSPEVLDERTPEETQHRALAPAHLSSEQHDHDHDHAPSTEGWVAVSRRWSRQQRFDRDALRAWLESTELERVKGIFRTSLGWFRAERAGGEVWMSRSTPRDCSMVDLIQQGELAEAEAHLEAVDDLRERPSSAAEDELHVEIQGQSPFSFTRLALAALPEQISDLSEHVPGRQGEAVRLQEILSLFHAPAGAQLTFLALDGMSSEPLPLETLGEELLVHSLSGEALPPGKGGPYRLFVPVADSKSPCQNMKQLWRILIEPPPQSPA